MSQFYSSWRQHSRPQNKKKLEWQHGTVLAVTRENRAIGESEQANGRADGNGNANVYGSTQTVNEQVLVYILEDEKSRYVLERPLNYGLFHACKVRVGQDVEFAITEGTAFNSALSSTVGAGIGTIILKEPNGKGCKTTLQNQVLKAEPGSSQKD